MNKSMKKFLYFLLNIFIWILASYFSLFLRYDGLLHLTLCGAGGYLLIAYLLCRTLSYDGIGKVNLIWNCMTIVTAFITGHLLFNEKFNKYTFYAIIFSMIAIYLMHLSSENESD